MRNVLSSFVASALFLMTAPAFAQDDAPTATNPPPAVATPAPAPAPAPATPAEQKDEKPKDRSAYISLSPFHLILPVVEVTAEIRLHERIGAAIIGGIGSVDPYQFSKTKPPPGVKTGRFTVWEVGGQFVSYPVGHFDHGMQLGAELLYVGVSGTAESGTASASGSGQGLSMGPFIGYKYTAPVGFALSLQAGVAYVTARADAKDSNGNTASDSDSQIAPIININLGWAF